MKLRQLHFVKSVAETRSFSRAAALCHATQPTLSNAIAQLEKELGGALFERTTRNVALTAFGKNMIGKINAVLEAELELRDAAFSFQNPETRLLRIGFSPLVDMKRLTIVLQPYQRQHPNLSVFFKECLLDDLQKRLADDMVDLAIIPHDPVMNGCKHFPFYGDPLFYLPCSQQKEGVETRKPDTISLSKLPDIPLILTGGGCGLNGSLERLFAQHGRHFSSYPGQAISYQIIEEWTDLGIGAGILPAAKLNLARERALPLTFDDGQPASFTFDWIWPAHAESRPHISDFIDYIRKSVPSLVQGSSAFITTEV